MNYTLEIEINQPRGRVVELFDNTDNLRAWQPGFLSYEHQSGEAGKPGAVSLLKYAHRNRKVEMTETLEVRNLPDEFSATFRAKGMKMVVRNYFKEAGPGKTLWTSENEAEVSGLLMRFIAFIMPGCFKKQSFQYMENFKAFVEDGKDLRKAE